MDRVLGHGELRLKPENLPATAAQRLAALSAAAIAQGVSGVALDLTPIEDELGDSARGGYRVPAARPELVRVGTR